MPTIKQLTDYADNHLVELLRSMFKGVQFKGRFRISRELDEIVSGSLDVHNIKSGKRLEYWSIYFDDEFMCSFTEEYHPITVDKLFLEGFLDAYEDGKIYLTPGLRHEEEAKRKQQAAIDKAAKEAQMEKDFQALKPEEKKIAKEIIKEVTKEKGHDTKTA